MIDPEDDFAALFEASVKATRFERGQTIEGTIVAIGSEVAFVERRRQGRSADRHRGVAGRGRRARGRGRRSHPGDGRVDGGRVDAVAPAGARRGDRPAARGRVPGRPAGGRQGRTGRQGRLRGAHRAPARLLPDVADRHPSALPIRRSTIGHVYAFKIIEYKEGGRNIVVSRRALLEEEQKAAGRGGPEIDRRRRRPHRPRRLGARLRRVHRSRGRRAGAAARLGNGLVARVGYHAGRHARRRDHGQGAARRRGEGSDRTRPEAADRRPVVDRRRRPIRSGRCCPGA